MYSTKVLNRNSDDNVLYQRTWLVSETVRFQKLQICERATLKAPEGKILTLLVNGIGCDIKPGVYQGDVVLAVTDPYIMEPHGLMRANQLSREFHCAAVVEDGTLSAQKCLPEIIRGGVLSNAGLKHARIASSEECFNGVVVAGDSEFTIKDVKVDFEGFGDNDYLGVGTAVTAIGKSVVKIEDSTFDVSGVTRCAIHAGGDSLVKVKNCRLVNFSPDTDWLGSFTWQLAVRGSNRLTQLTDNANVIYENCDMLSNGWGICSIDGTEESCKMVIRDSRLTLTGPRAHGYGVFCIGENEVVIERCQMDVEGYPLMLMGMEGLGKATITDSTLRSGHFGVFVVSDDNSVLDIKNSTLDAAQSALCIKGSSTIINIDNTEMTAGNGTLVQLMDTEEAGMDAGCYHVPVGVVDKPLKGRDLCNVSASEDVTINIKNSVLNGNILNSTTNIRAYKQSEKSGMGKFHDTVVGIMKLPPMGAGGPGDMPFPPEGMPPMGAGGPPAGMPPMGAGGPPAGMPPMGAGGPPAGMPPMGAGGPPAGMPPIGAEASSADISMLMPVMKRHNGDDLKGPKNLGIVLENTEVKGIISSATQAYRKGITVIDESNRCELSNITQTPAPTVNNGVSVKLASMSKWIVTGTSYITALEIEAGTSVLAEDGRSLRMTIDGTEVPLAPGAYTGKIVITVE